jgi:hypothetical protein
MICFNPCVILPSTPIISSSSLLEDVFIIIRHICKFCFGPITLCQIFDKDSINGCCYIPHLIIILLGVFFVGIIFKLGPQTLSLSKIRSLIADISHFYYFEVVFIWMSSLLEGFLIFLCGPLNLRLRFEQDLVNGCWNIFNYIFLRSSSIGGIFCIF